MTLYKDIVIKTVWRWIKNKISQETPWVFKYIIYGTENSQNGYIKNGLFTHDAGISEHPFMEKTKLDPYHRAHTRINYR